MANYTLISKYSFRMGEAETIIGFTDDHQLYSEMMFVKKATPLDTISSVTIKKGMMTSKLQYDIKIQKEGKKEQIFAIVQIDSADEQGVRFTNELKSKIPEFCVWNDKLEDKATNIQDASGTRRYDLQIMFFIKSKLFAGHGRGMQIAMNYGMMALATLGITLPLLIYVIAAGCHRVTTSDQGITIKKLTSVFFPWDEVDRIEVSKYNIVITNYGVQADSIFLMRFDLIAKNGTKKEFIIRSLEGKQFVKEMIERKMISADSAGMFI